MPQLDIQMFFISLSKTLISLMTMLIINIKTLVNFKLYKNITKSKYKKMNQKIKHTKYYTTINKINLRKWTKK